MARQISPGCLMTSGSNNLYQHQVTTKTKNMKQHIKIFSAIAFFAMLALAGCKKDKYTFGDVVAPAGLTLSANVVGTNGANPNGDGTGKVDITASALKALSYVFDYGDGTVETLSSGTITHKYNTPGTGTYTITVKAVGTGGAISTLSKQITVQVNFVIPPYIVTALTNDASRIWISDKNADGHFGVGPGDGFTPSYYAAPPNTREACAYDDEVTFTKLANGQISMALNNMGQSMSIAAATAYYGFGGPDGCYAIPGTTQTLSFMDATSASTTANSTRIQFKVPGKGNIIFGTGGTTYEILSVSATNLWIRNIGIDGNSWYQKLRVKP